MYNPWIDSTLLAMQSGGVMMLRACALAGGGMQAITEGELMVSEKVAAHTAATLHLMAGGSVQSMIASYRDIVQANTDRLMPAFFGRPIS